MAEDPFGRKHGVYVLQLKERMNDLRPSVIIWMNRYFRAGNRNIRPGETRL